MLRLLTLELRIRDNLHVLRVWLQEMRLSDLSNG